VLLRTVLTHFVLGTALFAQIRGAAVVEHPRPALLTWGSELRLWDPLTLESHTLLKDAGLGPGGCVADVNRDGFDDLLVAQGETFVFLQAPSFRLARVIERDTRFDSCLPLEIGKTRGVVISHLDAQLRFFDFERFESKELYSIYTNSRQGGLLALDVDRDGLNDLLFGNYWVRNPGRLDVAWRLFAINLFHDTPTAALARFALWPRPGRQPDLIWAESQAAAARLVWFERPADVHQLWTEHRLTPAPDYPKALLVLDKALYVGHANGVSRYRQTGDTWSHELVQTDGPVLGLFLVQKQVLVVTPNGVNYLRR